MKLKVFTILLILFISIADIKGQDYLIDFTGTGSTTTVTTVIVENLSKGTSLTMSGNDVLHLMGVITGTAEAAMDDAVKGIGFTPNPMEDYTRMQFVLPESGETTISIFDLSGRSLIHEQDVLEKGQHSYLIKGLDKGIYFAGIVSHRYSLSGRIVCTGSQHSDATIIYENRGVAEKKSGGIKGTTAESEMQYDTGDLLKMTGISGNYSTIITDIPDASKTINFNFVECADGDGNNYSVIEIGTAKGSSGNYDTGGEKGIQVWMAENLMSSKYNDGTVIPNVTDNTAWGGLTTPAYSWYNNSTSNKDIYGALYNWHAINTGKLCPAGWHVPNDTEWTTLTTFLGGENVAGGKLKETGTGHWASPNTGATNETGFTALPGGYRMSDGTFVESGNKSYWWSSTEQGSSYAYFRAVMYNTISVTRFNYNKKMGMYVRCLKN